VENTQQNHSSETSKNGYKIPVNLERLQEITRGKTAMQKRLLEIFLQASQGDINELRNALINHDFPTIVHKAHQLKGSSANVGVPTISVVAAELEKQARQQILTGANEMVDRMETYLQELQNFVQIHFLD